MFIQSDKIRIFPTSNRTAGDTGTNWVTEYNLASIINRLVDKPAFLISQTFDGNTIEFNINGYYIRADLESVISELPEGSTSLYAGIKIKEGSSISYNAIIQTDLEEGAESYADQGGKCKLVEFSSETFSDDYISIKLLTKASGSWELELTSKIMYDRNRILGIDKIVNVTTENAVTSGSSNNITSGAVASKIVEVQQEISTELEAISTELDNHKDATSAHTKSQIGLDQVDNTSDINKPVSTAQQTAITDAKNEVQGNLDNHINTKTGNPHNVTKGEIGLGNVSNVSTVDEVSETNANNISSRGVFSCIKTLQEGDIQAAKDAADAAQEDIDDHIANKTNPHAVSKSQVGLGNVANYSQTVVYTTSGSDTEKKSYFTREGANLMYTDLCGQLSTLIQNLQSIDEGEL